MNALNNTTRISIIRFQGKIQGTPIHILIDEGSTHSFLQPRIAKFLKLPIGPAPLFKAMSNGSYMWAKGRIQNLVMNA